MANEQWHGGRIGEAILNGNSRNSQSADANMAQSRAYAKGHGAPMINLTRGGQMGYAPDLKAWVSNANYIRRNLIPILLEAPRGFQFLPDPDVWVKSLRSLVEEYAIVHDGLNASYNVEVNDDNPVGGDGQKQREFTNVTVEQTSVTMRWNEKYGAPISTFWQRYIQYLMMDPSSKIAGISTLSTRPNDMLPDVYTFSMAFIEPDPHGKTVLRSWIVTNLFPDKAGEIIGRREITNSLEGQQIEINFGGIAQFGLGVNHFCQRILDSIDTIHASPFNREAFIEHAYGRDSIYDGDVEKLVRDPNAAGYTNSVARVKEQSRKVTSISGLDT